MYDARPASSPVASQDFENGPDLEIGADFQPGAQVLLRRARETQLRSRFLIEQARLLRSQRRLRLTGPLVSRKELLAYSPYARLLAQLKTLPVIEQAKGILMAQSGLSGDEAFAVLRRASQRSNVPVRELAARIVAKKARPPAAKTSRLARR